MVGPEKGRWGWFSKENQCVRPHRPWQLRHQLAHFFLWALVGVLEDRTNVGWTASVSQSSVVGRHSSTAVLIFSLSLQRKTSRSATSVQSSVWGTIAFAWCAMMTRMVWHNSCKAFYTQSGRHRKSCLNLIRCSNRDHSQHPTNQWNSRTCSVYIAVDRNN